MSVVLRCQVLLLFAIALYCLFSGSVSVLTSCSQSSRAGEVLVCSETGRRWDDLAVYVFGASSVSLRAFRVDWPLNCMSWERADVCEWLTFNVFLSVSFHLFCGLHLSGLFLPRLTSSSLLTLYVSVFLSIFFLVLNPADWNVLY